MIWHHPKYYKELERIRKQQEQADKRASERARRVGGPTSNEPGSEQASSAECDPNRWLRGKVFRGDQAEDRGSSYSRIVLQA